MPNGVLSVRPIFCKIITLIVVLETFILSVLGLYYNPDFTSLESQKLWSLTFGFLFLFQAVYLHKAIKGCRKCAYVGDLLLQATGLLYIVFAGAIYPIAFYQANFIALYGMLCLIFGKIFIRQSRNALFGMGS